MRMIFDQTGTLANVKRHDYLPFGEELFNGLRTTAIGYAANDTTRKSSLKKIETMKPASITLSADTILQYKGDF